MTWKVTAFLLIFGQNMWPNVFCIPSKSSLLNTANSLRHLIDGLQSTTDDKEENFFHKGLYPAYATTHLFGSKEMVFLRHAVTNPDRNVFSTIITFHLLLELSDFDPLTLTEIDNMTPALESLSRFRDQYTDGDHSKMCYNEPYLDENGSFRNTHYGEMSIQEEEEFVDRLMSVLISAGFDQGQLEKALPFVSMFRVNMPKTSTPPDFDSTMVNVALGGLLKMYHPTLFKQWVTLHSNVTLSVIEALKKYAYRPLSDDSNVNTIATKSYFFIKDFIQYRRNQGDMDIALVPVWIQVQDDIEFMRQQNQVFVNLNNDIDVTPCTNALMGVTYAITSGMWEPSILDDEDFQNLFLDTFSMLIYQVRTKFSGKMPFALAYYASEYQVYWWLSRIYSHLEDIIRQGKPLPHKALYTVHSDIQDVLRTVVTAPFLQSGQSDESDIIFYDDFANFNDPEGLTKQELIDTGKKVRHQLLTTLGEDNSDKRSLQADQTDLDQDGKIDDLLSESLDNTIKDINRYQRIDATDRIFTTAVIVNLLLSSWTHRDITSGKLVWHEDTPSRVKSIVNKAVTWLDRNTLSGEYRPEGVFFTASPMTDQFQPQRFPYNVNRHMDGRENDSVDKLVGFGGILGVSGVMPEDEYQQKLKELWGDDDWIHKPQTFREPDVSYGLIQFTSEAYTYTAVLVALRKFAAML